MDCRLIQGELLPYTLGTSSEEERDRVDLHILSCTTCLRAYIRLKHQVDRGASIGVRPSDETRRRIRADVAALVRPRGVARVRDWLRRPIPLYQGLAVAAVATGIALGVPQVSFGRRAPETMAHVDMSKPMPQAHAIY